MEEFQKVVEYLKGRFSDHTELCQDRDFSTGNYWVRLYKSKGYHFRVEVTRVVLEDFTGEWIIEKLKQWKPDPVKECAVVVKRDGLEEIGFHPWEKK